MAIHWFAAIRLPIWAKESQLEDIFFFIIFHGSQVHHNLLIVQSPTQHSQLYWPMIKFSIERLSYLFIIPAFLPLPLIVFVASRRFCTSHLFLLVFDQWHIPPHDKIIIIMVIDLLQLMFDTVLAIRKDTLQAPFFCYPFLPTPGENVLQRSTVAEDNIN